MLAKTSSSLFRKTTRNRHRKHIESAKATGLRHSIILSFGITHALILDAHCHIVLYFYLGAPETSPFPSPMLLYTPEEPHDGIHPPFPPIMSRV